MFSNLIPPYNPLISTCGFFDSQKFYPINSSFRFTFLNVLFISLNNIILLKNIEFRFKEAFLYLILMRLNVYRISTFAYMLNCGVFFYLALTAPLNVSMLKDKPNIDSAFKNNNLLTLAPNEFVYVGMEFYSKFVCSGLYEPDPSAKL